MEHAELSPVFDQKLRGYICTGPIDDTAMLLEQLFKHLPSEGERNLVDDVVGCTSDQELCQLAGNIDLGFLRPIKVAAGKRLPNTRFLTIDGGDGDDYFKQLVEKGMVKDDPIVWKQLRLRRDCLYRDGDMCVVSKLFNTSSKRKPPGKMTMRLEVAHILPFGLGDFSEKFWNSLYRYFPAVRTHANLECANLNILENAMMLSTALFDDFSDFAWHSSPQAFQASTT